MNRTTFNPIDQHIKELKFKDHDSYKQWCRENDLSVSLNKSSSQLSKERKLYSNLRAIVALKNRPNKKLKQIINEIRDGANEKEFIDEIHREMARQYIYIKREYYVEYANIFLDVLIFLDNCSKLTKIITYIKALAQVVISKDNWIRSFDEWEPKSHNVHKQFSLFIRHLMAQYDVPIFMDKAWITDTFEYRKDWFVHIASGKNIRTAKNLPFTLTKKEAHFFLEAPDDCAINEAFNYGKLMALGGNERLFNAIRPTFLVRTIQTTLPKFSDSTNFHQSIIKFFIDNPMLDQAHIGPICDYIYNQKYVEQRIFVQQGQVDMAGVLQPNFSMVGRTPESLLKQVERWHRQLGKETKGGNIQWPHCSIKDFEIQLGTNEKHNVRFWTIKEQLCSKELSELGRTLRNCVASYSHSCQRGICSIWNLTYEAYEKKEALLAIEVTRLKQICQIRGRYNRLATHQEMGIIMDWANKEGITLANYLK